MQELALQGIGDYEVANACLQDHFIPSFHRNFTVTPSEPESAFTSVQNLCVDLVLSVQHTRIVRPDNTVSFRSLVLQLPPSADRMHYVRYPVTVHELTNHTLGITYLGTLLAIYDIEGRNTSHPQERRGLPQQVA